MAMPKSRRSKSRTASHRAAAWKLVQSCQYNKCPNCGAPVVPHVVCDNCGYYKGKKVLVTRAERHEVRKVRRRKEKEERGR